MMGNLNNQTWDELWNSPEAEKVRAKVRCCDRDCWMIGSVNSVGSWYRNVAKKVLVLGVPYATFTTATWVLKKVFSSSVNDQIGGLGETLFFHPTAPYWYLYALFFIFLVTPTFNSVKAAAVGSIIFSCTVSSFPLQLHPSYISRR